MNINPNHYPHSLAEPAVATFCDGGLSGRAGLRQVLSRLGLRASETQEEVLLELIHCSHSRKQHIVC